MTLSETLLKVKSAGMVILGNELNKDVSFESCIRGTEAGNQELSLSFAALFVAGANLDSGSVLTELNREGDVDVPVARSAFDAFLVFFSFS